MTREQSVNIVKDDKVCMADMAAWLEEGHDGGAKQESGLFECKARNGDGRGV